MDFSSLNEKNKYIDKMFMDEKLKQIIKRKDEVATIYIANVYIRGSGRHPIRSQ